MPLFTSEDTSSELRNSSLKFLPGAPREVELQYLMPQGLAEELIKWITPTRLITYYLPKNPELVQHLAHKCKLHHRYSDVDSLSVARLRHSISVSGEHQYMLEFKSSKQELAGLGKIDRAEPEPVLISKRTYNKLRSKVAEGMIDKLRYKRSGFVFRNDGTHEPITLEIDHVLRATRSGEELKHSYFRADIEVRPDQVESIRAGRTSFSEELRQCVELATLKSKKRKEFSHRRVAKHGYTDELNELSRGLISTDLSYLDYYGKRLNE
jgi:hypothetical protein